MANNRMWIRCTQCDEKVLFCKYYPSTDWYIYKRDNDSYPGEWLNHWFEMHMHDLRATASGPTHFELQFEEPNG